MVILLPMNGIQTLDKIPLLKTAFNGLSEHELEEMAALTEMRTYPPNHVLCLEGAHEDTFYIIAGGSAVISKKIGDQLGLSAKTVDNYRARIMEKLGARNKVDAVAIGIQRGLVKMANIA